METSTNCWPHRRQATHSKKYDNVTTLNPSEKGLIDFKKVKAISSGLSKSVTDLMSAIMTIIKNYLAVDLDCI